MEIKIAPSYKMGRKVKESNLFLIALRLEDNNKLKQSRRMKVFKQLLNRKVTADQTQKRIHLQS